MPRAYAFRYICNSGHVLSKLYKSKGSVDKQVMRFGGAIDKAELSPKHINNDNMNI